MNDPTLAISSEAEHIDRLFDLSPHLLYFLFWLIGCNLTSHLRNLSLDFQSFFWRTFVWKVMPTLPFSLPGFMWRRLGWKSEVSPEKCSYLALWLARFLLMKVWLEIWHITRTRWGVHFRPLLLTTKAKLFVFEFPFLIWSANIKI